MELKEYNEIHNRIIEEARQACDKKEYSKAIKLYKRIDYYSKKLTLDSTIGGWKKEFASGIRRNLYKVMNDGSWDIYTTRDKNEFYAIPIDPQGHHSWFGDIYYFLRYYESCTKKGKDESIKKLTKLGLRIIKQHTRTMHGINYIAY